MYIVLHAGLSLVSHRQYDCQGVDVLHHVCSSEQHTGTTVQLVGAQSVKVSERVSSFLTAHQHRLGYLVPYNDVEDTTKERRYSKVMLRDTNACNLTNIMFV